MALTTSSLSFQYNDQNRFRFPDVDLNDGEQLLILGPSGTGKSTLLHLLAGILAPASGQLTINKTILNHLRARQLDRFRGRQIGIVFQRSYFVHSLSVEENLVLAQKLAGKPSDKNRIQEVLQAMDVAGKMKEYPADLSVGEQQRVSIARAVINSPALLLADEPTSALDDENAERVASLLTATAKQQNANLVVVTHDNRLKNRFNNVLSL